MTNLDKLRYFVEKYIVGNGYFSDFDVALVVDRPKWTSAQTDALRKSQKNFHRHYGLAYKDKYENWHLPKTAYLSIRHLARALATEYNQPIPSWSLDYSYGKPKIPAKDKMTND